MRNGSGKLLCTLMMRLLLVTEYISGPGNCPLIRIPWNTYKNVYSVVRYQTKQRIINFCKKNTKTTNLLFDPKWIDVPVGNIPCKEPVRILRTDKNQSTK